MATLESRWAQLARPPHPMLSAFEPESKQVWKQVTWLTFLLCIGTTSGAFLGRYCLGSLSGHQETSKHSFMHAAPPSRLRWRLTLGGHTRTYEYFISLGTLAELRVDNLSKVCISHILWEFYHHSVLTVI